MKRTFALLFTVLCLALCSFGAGATESAWTNLAERIHFSMYADLESAYWMRGVIADTRPYSSQFADMTLDLSPVGRVGAFVWSASSTSTGGQSASRRNFYNEFIYTAFYGYEVELSGRWSLDTVFYKQWVDAPGYFPHAHSRSEINLSQSLNNPYLTPYYLMRRAIHGAEWCYWEVGVTRSWKLNERLKLTATIFGELGDDQHFLAQYGPEPNGDIYRHGLMALNAKLRFDYALNKNAGLFAYVHQFNMVDSDARDAVEHSSAPQGRTEQTIFGAGVTFKF